MNPEELLQRLGCAYAFYEKPAGGEAILLANEERFRSASLIKVPILLAWLALERAGQLDRGEICNLDSEPPVQGAGLSWLLQARRLPYADVLLLMIALSDNLCTNLIIQRAGMDTLNAAFTDLLGLQHTRLERKMMDLEARARGRDNRISAQDSVRLYALLDALPPAERAWVDGLLLANHDLTLLARDLPRDTIEFYHKTGSLQGVLNDWGYTRTRQMFLLTNGGQEGQVNAVFGILGGRLLG